MMLRQIEVQMAQGKSIGICLQAGRCPRRADTARVTSTRVWRSISSFR